MKYIIHYPTYGRKQLISSQLPSYLNNILAGINARVESIKPFTRDFWEVEIESGQNDPGLVRSFLVREIGLRVRPEELEEGMILLGRVSSTNVGFGLFIDIGLRPKKDGLLPLHYLRTLIPETEGKKRTLRNVLSLFGWGVGWPLRVEIDSLEWRGSEPKMNLKLEDLFFNELVEYFHEGNEMLNIIGVSRSEIHRALRSSGHKQDIVYIQSHGILEHTLFCSLKTRASGIIPEIGPHLKRGRFFSVGASLKQGQTKSMERNQ